MTQPRSADKKKILVVEDHPVFRAMLVQLIENELEMAVCGQADNTRDAMTLIEQTLPDAAIVDLTLRESSGLELIEDLRRRHNRLPVLILSMHTELLYAQRVRQAGARGYIAKEESPATVVKAIRQVMAGGIYFSEGVNRQVG